PQFGFERAGVARQFRITEHRGDSAFWGKVKADAFASHPVGRNLQNGGAAQAAVRNQHFPAKFLSLAGGGYVGRHSAQIAVRSPLRLVEDQGNQPWAGLANLHSELPGKVVAQRSRSHFWNRQAAGSDDKSRRTKFCGRRFDPKFVSTAYLT